MISKRYENKKIGIVGFGVTGQAVAKFLISNGAEVFVYENRQESDFDQVFLNKFQDAQFYFEQDDFDPKSFDFIVVSPGLHPDSTIIQKANKQNIPIYNDLTLFIENWREVGPIIGVTGSNGKTTVVSLLYQCLKLKKPTILGGNIGKSPLDLIDIKHKKGTLAVLEVSSGQLEMFREEHYLDICVITNLSSNHLDRYAGKMSKYAEVKTMGINLEKTKTIITIDDPYTLKYISPIIKRANLTFVSLETPFDQITNDGIYTNNDGQIISKKDDLIDVCFKNPETRELVGIHNLYNIAFVLAVLKEVGVKIDSSIVKVLREFRGLEHRIEKVIKKKGVTYINDSKSTSPEAIRVALIAVGENKNIVLIIGGRDKDMSFGFLRDVFIQKVKSLIIISGNLDKKIIKLAQSANNLEFKIVPSMEEAVILAKTKTTEGDIVLLSPGSSSTDIYKNFEERGRDFKGIVKKL